MKPFLKILSFSLIIIVSPLFIQPSPAKSVEQVIKETGILKVGVRQDSPLFGSGENAEGYCVDFATQLGENLSETLGKPIDIQLIPSTIQTRWQLVSQGKVDLECGPNTISLEREQQYNIQFSQPFFYTATQIFVEQTANEAIVRQGKIGVIPDTTNEGDLLAVYQPDQIQNQFSSREQGIKAVTEGSLAGFASDGILLLGTALNLNLTPDQFNLITPILNNRPFCANYGMILPTGEENKSWRERVNGVIMENGKGTDIWGKWFLPFYRYMETVLQGCYNL